MAVLRIAKMGNPVLMQKAAPVDDPTAPEIRQLAADMQETLEDIGASGLAAHAGVRAEARGGLPHHRRAHSRGLGPRAAAVDRDGQSGHHAEERRRRRRYGSAACRFPGCTARCRGICTSDISYSRICKARPHTHDAHSSWAALLQHECDHLDGIALPDAHDRPLAARLQRGARAARERGARRIRRASTRCSSTWSSAGRDASAGSADRCTAPGIAFGLETALAWRRDLRGGRHRHHGSRPTDTGSGKARATAAAPRRRDHRQAPAADRGPCPLVRSVVPNSASSYADHVQEQLAIFALASPRASANRSTRSSQPLSR